MMVQKAGVAFTLHEYDYDPNAERIGLQAAEALGIAPARMLKTLDGARRQGNGLRAGAVGPGGQPQAAGERRRRQGRRRCCRPPKPSA